MLARSQSRKIWVAIVIAGMLNPSGRVSGESPASKPAAPPVPDVRLDADRRFHGVVVDGQGQPVAQIPVKITSAAPPTAGRSAPESQTVRTDERGRFMCRELAAGSYRIETATGACLCRLWTFDAAPPSAAGTLLVVNDPRIARGQRPMAEFFRTDAVLMATVVAAAIAIPIIVHKSQDDAPEGS